VGASAGSVAPPAAVLVLGGSGFLGAHLARAFAARSKQEPGGVLVHAASRSPGPIAPGAQFHAFDASLPGALPALLDALAPSLVLNACAHARLAECERAPELAELLNADLPGRLAVECRRRGARLVQVSTDLVFGNGAPQRGWREDDRAEPLSVYGRTKLAGEQRVLEAGGDALVVRLPLLYGDSFGRELGASDALHAALARGERPRLYVDELRTPLEVSLAAELVRELARGTQRGLLHVAGPRRLSRHELGLELLAAGGIEPAAARARLDAVPRSCDAFAALRPADAALDTTRARELGLYDALGGFEALHMRGLERAARRP